MVKRVTKEKTKALIAQIIEDTVVEPGDDLNPMQKAFCKEYIWDWNGTRAYRKVYRSKSDAMAAVRACALVRTVKVRKYLQHLNDNLEAELGVSRAKVLSAHMKMAFNNSNRYLVKQRSLEAISKLMGYEATRKVDLTSRGERISMGSTFNVQINIYNNAPPLASSESEIKD